MNKIIVIALLAVAVGLGLYFMNANSSTSATAMVDVSAAGLEICGVSKVKNNPEQYLGNIKISGKAAKIYPNDGVIEIADAKACCAIYLMVPTTDAQKDKLGVANLYQGTFPQKGQDIIAEGLLEKTTDGYAFIVSKVTSNDAKVLVERI
jgi:hypothetical protein